MKKFLTVLLSSTFLLNTLNAEEMPVLENDNEVKEVLKNLGIKNECGISNMSEYDKAKIIHDYIVKNIFYDYAYKNYSAYNAIIG